MPKKKKRLFDHFADASKEKEGPCQIDAGVLKPCPVLAAVIAVGTEDNSKSGFEYVPMFQMSTGKSTGKSLVYFARRAEYVDVEYCPFCGKKVRDARKKLRGDADLCK